MHAFNFHRIPIFRGVGVFDKGFGRDDYHEGNSYGKSQKTYYCCDGSSCQETNEHKLGCQLTRSVCEWLCGGNFAEKHYCCNKGNYICEEKSHGGANCYNDREKCNSECKDDTPKEFFYCCIEKNGSKQCVKEDSNIPGGNCQKTKTGCENVCKDRKSIINNGCKRLIWRFRLQPSGRRWSVRSCH